jgi:precorrin-6B methylase 2
VKRSPEHARIRNKEIYDDRVYHFRLNNEHPFIIDCGANYGVSVTWFKQFSPNARITAVEADPNIFAILKRNIDRFN